MTINKKAITNAILLIITAGVFLWIGLKTDWKATGKAIGSANPLWVSASLLVMILSHWLRGYRWNMLTAPAGYPLNAKRSFLAVMSGYLINVATSRGGEVVRCALASKSEKAPVALLIGTVVTERLVDMLMLLLVCVTGLLVEFDHIYSFFQSFVLVPAAKAATTSNLLILLALIALLWFVLRMRKKSAAKKEAAQGGIAAIVSRFSAGLKSVFTSCFYLPLSGFATCSADIVCCKASKSPRTCTLEVPLAYSFSVLLALPFPCRQAQAFGEPFRLA